MYKLLIILFIGCSSPFKPMEITNPTKAQAKFPRLFTDNSGTVFMSWYEDVNNTTQLYFSTYKNNIWSEPTLISESDSWFVNWADFPSVIGINGNALATHWLQKSSNGTYSYDVTIGEAKNNFASPFVPHKDGTPTEHGFASMVPLSDSSFFAVWLDGRNTFEPHDHNYRINDLSRAMTLRGSLIQKNKEVIDHQIDPSICDCCNTTLTQTSNGLLVAYRNRTEDEIRDIYASSYSLDSQKWSKPKVVHNDHWKIAACPVNGPMMDSIEDNIAIAWFTGAFNKPVVKLSFSSNAGTTFMEPVIIDNEIPLGRVDVILSSPDYAWVSWMSKTEKWANLKIALVSKSKGIMENYIISDISPSRSVGFPQLTKLSNGMMLAWTEINENKTSIRTMIIPYKT